MRLGEKAVAMPQRNDEAGDREPLIDRGGVDRRLVAGASRRPVPGNLLERPVLSASKVVVSQTR